MIDNAQPHLIMRGASRRTKLSVLNYLAALVAILAVVAAPAAARSRKGDKLVKDARLAEAKRDYDTALELFEQALVTDPSDTSYLMGVRRVRFQAGQKHVEAAMKLREDGKLEEALAKRRFKRTRPRPSRASK